MKTMLDEEYEVPQRAIVFVDGNNLYHRLKDQRWKTKVNIGHLAIRVVGNRELVHTYYYNSPPLGDKPYTEKANQYYSWIMKTPNLTFRRSRLQRVTNTDEYGEYQSYKEKGADTALSTDLVSLAAKDEYDVAILVTSDGDYEPAVRTVCDDYGKSVEVVYFRGRRPFALEACALMREFRQSYLEEYDYKPTRQRGQKGRRPRISTKRRRHRP